MTHVFEGVGEAICGSVQSHQEARLDWLRNRGAWLRGIYAVVLIKSVLLSNFSTLFLLASPYSVPFMEVAVLDSLLYSKTTHLFH